MKKFLLLLVSLFLIGYPVFGEDSTEFLNSLNLSEQQKLKITEIDKKYKCEIVKLRANIILNSMNIAKTGNRKASQSTLNYELNALQDEIDALELEKEHEIASNLKFFQRIKYKRYCKKLHQES